MQYFPYNLSPKWLEIAVRNIFPCKNGGVCPGQQYISYTENMAHIQDGTEDANKEEGAGCSEEEKG